MNSRAKKSGFFFEHRYAIVCFLYVVLYNFLIVNRLEPWKVSNITYAYHIVDYSLGFRSQLLPGAIFYGLFGDRASKTTATVYETVLMLLFFAGVSILLERLLRKMEQKDKIPAFILILFYLSGPFTFAIFTDELGMLDSYWLFFSLLFFLLQEKRGMRFLIPVLYALSILIHFSSVLNYLILFSILLLYQVANSEDIKAKKIYLSVFLLSLIGTAFLFLYFLLFQTKNIPVSIDKFHQMLENRGSNYFVYYDYSLYNWYGNREVVPSSILSIQNPVWRTIRMIIEKCRFTMWSYANDPHTHIVHFSLTFFVLGPIVYFFYKHLIRFYRSIQNNCLKRFCLFLMMVQFPFTVIVGGLFSPDIIRWSTHAFLIFFTMLLYLLYHEELLKSLLYKDIERYKKNPVIWLYSLEYLLINAWAYC